MLSCIIYRSQWVFGNILNQYKSNYKKGFDQI
jgi:hypothetical protein